MLKSIAQFLQTYMSMEPIDPQTAKRALASYIKGLLQDYSNMTGMYVEQLPITYAIRDNKRVVQDVDVITDLEVPLL